MALGERGSAADDLDAADDAGMPLRYAGTAEIGRDPWGQDRECGAGSISSKPRSGSGRFGKPAPGSGEAEGPGGHRATAVSSSLPYSAGRGGADSRANEIGRASCRERV